MDSDNTAPNDLKVIWQFVPEGQKQKCIEYLEILKRPDMSATDMSDLSCRSVVSVHQIRRKYKDTLLNVSWFFDASNEVPAKSGQYLCVVQHSNSVGDYTEQTQVFYDTGLGMWHKDKQEVNVIGWCELLR
jgi:hypothetical protein